MSAPNWRRWSANPSSIPAPLQKLRSRLAEETGVPEAALPFVGELIQVRQEQGAWQGAIERVLFGFAQSLLVEDKHYNEVNAWVNRTHLGMRLTYYRVRRNDDAIAREPSARSLLHKLEFRDSVFEPWLRRELGKRYDYECVEAKQLRDVDRGISREGQVKHPGDRFEKDDRNSISDRRRWLLGFSNTEKLALFRKEAQELAQRIAACDEDVVGCAASATATTTVAWPATSWSTSCGRKWMSQPRPSAWTTLPLRCTS